MKITYIGHSGFSAELDNMVLLFDYHTGSLPTWDKNKQIYVFVSHKHQDHFNLQIFDLLNQYNRVHYFLGSDVKLSDNYLKRNHISPDVKKHITNVGKNQRFQHEKMRIQTLRSTDAGVAYIVNVQDRCIYHAGDLNWWHWEGESVQFNANMEQAYRQAIDSVKGMHFDAAFVPLDPRQEGNYLLGMNYFLKNTKADYVFPMHMWDEYSTIGKYKKTENGKLYASHIVDIQAPGQEFLLWNM